MRELHPDALYSPAETTEIVGCGRTTVYELIGDGSLTALKLGSSTKITGKSIIALRDSLPKIAARKQRAA